MLFNFQILDREKDSRRGKQAGEKLDILKNFCTNFKPHTSSIISQFNKAIIRRFLIHPKNISSTMKPIRF